ncbi:hypothetical protein CVT91_00300 [Candidatus Atribacteria bacterium HGW-Atribacteria-1]|nr:MAG: hypothetical protein CVT91_00300 [Candidatus Atribacteria bacterium HGW-Atribacteria-1]
MRGPIPRVLSIFLEHKVRSLLMGGQACILYGAAEFSRDIDFAVMVSEESLYNLKRALGALEAEEIFVPALSEEVLRKGHACHFRCHKQDVENLRIDIMGVMRGVMPFSELWERRVEIDLPEIGRVPVMALADLVRAKKTQRDKDWYMIRRLIESDIYKFSSGASREKIFFWLMECRTPELLVSLTGKYPEMARSAASGRSLLNSALRGDTAETAVLLKDEEDREKELDRLYWRPLMAELEKWRHEKKIRNA